MVTFLSVMLLEAEYRHEDTAGARLMAGCLRDGETYGFEVELRAIVAALTPPEGFVLVPVELSTGMARVLGCRACLNTHDLQALWADMLAARPEVP